AAFARGMTGPPGRGKTQTSLVLVLRRRGTPPGPTPGRPHTPGAPARCAAGRTASLVREPWEHPVGRVHHLAEDSRRLGRRPVLIRLVSQVVEILRRRHDAVPVCLYLRRLLTFDAPTETGQQKQTRQVMNLERPRQGIQAQPLAD